VLGEKRHGPSCVAVALPCLEQLAWRADALECVGWSRPTVKKSRRSARGGSSTVKEMRAAPFLLLILAIFVFFWLFDSIVPGW
jgi:hypothetical protein